MKAVLISIQPKWCELIASGKKTVEVRKTAPKLTTPFKCYLYMTKSGNPALEIHDKDGNSYAVEKNYRMAGKIIGEFMCDKIDTIRDERNGFVAGGVQRSEWHSAAQTLIQAACLTEKELKAYLGNDYGYGWHISDLKIYDKPKELEEFYKSYGECDGCKYLRIVDGYCNKYKQFLDYYDGYISCERCCKITCAPQSWRYVEV